MQFVPFLAVVLNKDFNATELQVKKQIKTLIENSSWYKSVQKAVRKEIAVKTEGQHAQM